MGISIESKHGTISHPVTLTKQNSDCLQKAKYLTICSMILTDCQKEFPMDELDRRLIALLRATGRLPAATLAKTLKVSRAERCKNRIDRRWPGCHPGFTVRLHPETEHGRVRAIKSIAVEGRGRRR